MLIRLRIESEISARNKESGDNGDRGEYINNPRLNAETKWLRRSPANIASAILPAKAGVTLAAGK